MKNQERWTKNAIIVQWKTKKKPHGELQSTLELNENEHFK